MLKMISIKQLSILFLALTLLTSCSKDDDTNPLDKIVDNDSDAQVTALVNGEHFASNDFEGAVEAQLVLMTIDGKQSYFLSIAGAKLSGSSLSAVGISFGDEDFTDLVVGKEHSGTANEEGAQYALGTYQIENGEETEASATTEGSSNANVIITAIDKDEKIISGTFTFTAFDPDTEVSYVITEGKFTNIEY